MGCHLLLTKGWNPVKIHLGVDKFYSTRFQGVPEWGVSLFYALRGAVRPSAGLGGVVSSSD